MKTKIHMHGTPLYRNHDMITAEIPRFMDENVHRSA